MRETRDRPARDGSPVPARLAFEEIYQARYGDVLAMVYSLVADFAEAQDIAQEAFSRAWQHWPAIHERDEPIAWVKRVAANLAMSRLRRLRIARRFGLRQRPTVTPAISEDRVAVVAELRRLPPKVAKAVVLFYIGDLSVEQIAEMMHTNSGTVKSWLHRGRIALADRLTQEGTVTDA